MDAGGIRTGAVRQTEVVMRYLPPKLIWVNRPRARVRLATLAVLAWTVGWTLGQVFGR